MEDKARIGTTWRPVTSSVTLIVSCCLLVNSSSENQLVNEIENNDGTGRDKNLLHIVSNAQQNYQRLFLVGFRKHRGPHYLHTRLSYTVKSSSTFHVSRLPLSGEVATNPGSPKTIAGKFPCKDCGRPYEEIRTPSCETSAGVGFTQTVCSYQRLISVLLVILSGTG